jgi:hypothetical protein
MQIMYWVVYLVSLACKATANILTTPVREESMADAWMRQRARFKEAIDQALARNAAIEPVGADDASTDEWGRQQARLREAIARAKRENAPGGDVRDAPGPGKEHSSQ